MEKNSFEVNTPKKKTFEEHCHSSFQIAKLMLWFLWNWLNEHTDEGFIDALRMRVDLCRKIDFRKGKGYPNYPDFEFPLWLELEAKLQLTYELHRQDNSAHAFEAEAFDILREHLKARCRIDYGSVLTEGYQCGSLKYEKFKYAKYDPQIEGLPKECVRVHIENAVQPQSIFAVKNYLPRCFLCLMNKSEKEYSANSLCINCWLNSKPRWLELFPQEYLDNMTSDDKNIRYTMGYWGQFINSRGCFNEKYGGFLRKTGRFPFYKRLSWCTFAAMRMHLTEYLSNGTPQRRYRK